MRHYIICTLWLLLSLPLFVRAQSAKAIPPDSCSYHLEGTILDITNRQPLPFATVQIKGSATGTIADEEGHFVFHGLCQQEFDLVISHIGYKQAVHHHDVHHPAPSIYLAPDHVTLESVIVEGQAQPGDLYSGSVESLSDREMELNSAESLGDLASSVTGVSMLKTGQNVVKPVIHGLHSNRILIVNNGVRHEFQSWGEDHAPEIDPSLAQELHVVKGAATVRYGPNALGGVLIINPPTLELLEPWQGEAGMTAKTNGRSLEGKLQLQKGYRRMALLGQASYLHQGDLHTPDYLLSNTGRREQSLALGSRYHRASFDLSAYYSHFGQELGILRGSVTGNLEDLAAAINSGTPPMTRPFSYDISNPRQTVQHDLLKLRSLWNGKNQSVEAQYALQLNRRKEFDVRRGTNNDRAAINLQLFTHTLDLEWKHPDIRQWQGHVGMQVLYQDNNNLPGTNTIPFVPNYNNSRIGVYMVGGRPLGSSRLEAGLRYDYQHSSIRGRASDNSIYSHNLQYQNATATLGLVREIREGQVLRTNIGTAWRPPNISELYSFGKHRASIEYGLWRYTTTEDQEISTDRVLDASDRAVPSEMGIKWIGTYEISREHLQSDITTYFNYIQHYIYTRPAGITQTVRGAFPYFIYAQDDAVFAGIDASVRLVHSSTTSSTLKGSLLWAKNISRQENFAGLPPASLQYQWSQQLPVFAFVNESYWSLSAGYTFRQYQAPRVVPVERILSAKAEGINLFAENSAIYDILPAPPGYLLAHVSWTGHIQQFRVGLQVRNIFNKAYRNYTDRLRYFADETGRNIQLSLRYVF